MKREVFEKRQTLLLDKLKNNSSKILQGYALDKLLFNISGFAIEASFCQAIKDCLRHTICRLYKMDAALDDNPLLLVTYNYKRADHDQAWKSTKQIFDLYDEIKIEETVFSKANLLSPALALKSFIKILQIIGGLKPAGSLKERIFMAGRLIELERLRDDISNLNIKSKVSLTFFDGGSYENLITQNLKKRGIKTVTMQHGQPVFHGNDTDRINQTMILNFSSDYVIVTGEFSKKQFALGHVPESSIRVLGSWRTIHDYREKFVNAFALFLDCPTMPKANKNNRVLISLAEQLAHQMNCKFKIRLHPQDARENYKDICLQQGYFLSKDKTIRETLENTRFALLHSSGVYLDILAYGIKSFCLVNSSDLNLVEFDLDKFSNMEELLVKMDRWQKLPFTDRKIYMQKVVDYYLSPTDSKERHKKFIKELM